MNAKHLLVAAVAVALLVSPTPILAQEAESETGSIWRMVYYEILPGQADAFWRDMNENARPILDIAVREGILLGYRAFSNPMIAGPDDWDVLLMLEYPNYAALDAVPEIAARSYAEHFGSDERAAQESAKRDQWRRVLRIRIVEEVPLQ